MHTAAILLRQDRFAVEYEHYAATKQRGPDFTVTFKTHTLFNVEVRRLPSDPSRLAPIVCEKIGQLPASIINVLWLTGEGGTTIEDLQLAIVQLRQATEAKDEPYFQRHGFSNAADFAKRFPRLSGCLLRQNGTSVLWLNPQARHAIPSDLASALKRLA